MSDIAEFSSLLRELPEIREKCRAMREIVLANTVMFGEIPGPTFAEEGRIRFLANRFTESGLHNISVDETGNGSALLPGSKGKRNILVSAHADTLFEASVDHTVTVGTDGITGPGVADNSLGLAVVASLPLILERLGIQLQSNLVFLGSTRSLGKGDLAGLRFFLNNFKMPLAAAVCLEGIHLGRLSYNCLGMLRGEIRIRAMSAGNNHWQSRGASAAVSRLGKLIERMMAIPLPQEPKTSIILGSIAGGKAFNTPPIETLLRFEVRSEQSGMVSQLQQQIEDIVEEIHDDSEVDAHMSIIARRKPGGISFTHPMVKRTRSIMSALDIVPRTAPSVGDLSAIISKGIPAVTLGLTQGSKKASEGETVLIDPLFSGIAQLVGLLIAIDRGDSNHD